MLTTQTTKGLACTLLVHPSMRAHLSAHCYFLSVVSCVIGFATTDDSVPECETCRYLPAPDYMLALDIAYTIYMKFGDLASALRIAPLLDKVSG